jgi:hypothetical protein
VLKPLSVCESLLFAGHHLWNRMWKFESTCEGLSDHIWKSTWWNIITWSVPKAHGLKWFQMWKSTWKMSCEISRVNSCSFSVWVWPQSGVYKSRRSQPTFTVVLGGVEYVSKNRGEHAVLRWAVEHKVHCSWQCCNGAELGFSNAGVRTYWWVRADSGLRLMIGFCIEWVLG